MCRRILTILLLVAYPIVDAFWLSLHRYNLRRPDAYAFVGLQNYLDVLTSDQFLPSLGVTLFFTFWSTVGVLVMALGMALVANEHIPQRAILRALILLPWAMSGVVTALMWKWIFNPNAGALNGLLYSLGFLSSYRSWLMAPDTSYLAIITANVWNTLPFSVLVLLAGLQAIPAELYDAAKVDRASLCGAFSPRHAAVAFATDPDRADRAGARRHPDFRHHLSAHRWWAGLPDDHARLRGIRDLVHFDRYRARQRLVVHGGGAHAGDRDLLHEAAVWPRRRPFINAPSRVDCATACRGADC